MEFQRFESKEEERKARPDPRSTKSSCRPDGRPSWRLAKKGRGSPWIREGHSGSIMDKWDCPVVDKATYQCTREGVFFGRRFGVGTAQHHLGGWEHCAPSGDQHPTTTATRSALTERPPAGDEPSRRRRWASTSGATRTTTNPGKREKMKARRSRRALQEDETSTVRAPGLSRPEQAAREGRALLELRHPNGVSHRFALHRVRRLRRRVSPSSV